MASMGQNELDTVASGPRRDETTDGNDKATSRTNTIIHSESELEEEEEAAAACPVALKTIV